MQNTSWLPRPARLRSVTLPALLGLLLATSSCTDSSGPKDDPTVKPPADLTILSLGTGSPALATDSVSFYASFDEQREGTIDFADNERYLRFRVDAGALFKLPNGSLLGPGDSVLITIKVVDPSKLYFDFEPQGLKFNPLIPAELNLEYAHASGSDTTQAGDFNDDGAVDAEDDAIESTLAIWHQTIPGGAFTRLTSILTIESDEIEADIPGFSRYALAY